MKDLLLIRADADPKIGMGHMMRCLALAQAWNDSGGTAAWVSHSPPATGADRIRSEGITILNHTARPGSCQDSAALAAVAAERKASWVVVDGYQFQAEYHARIKESGAHLLVIDDSGIKGKVVADIVVNPNPHASVDLYSIRDPHVRLLLGPKYILLRREFQARRAYGRSTPRAVHRILITLGGAPPIEVLRLIVRAIRNLLGPDDEVVVVSGALSSTTEPLHDDLRHSPVRVEHDPASMPDLMSWADVAITAAGSTVWEAAFLGLPTLVITLAENQRPIARALGRLGASMDLGWHHRFSSHRFRGSMERLLRSFSIRARMTRRGRELVDGEGCSRVLMHLKGIPLRLRRLKASDCRKLWTWANDPETRTASFTSRTISWETHTRWFEQTLSSQDRFVFLALDERDFPIGQVRFDRRTQTEFDVSVSIDHGFRGRGLSVFLLRQGIESAAQELNASAFHAYVKPENLRSIRAVETAGFSLLGETRIRRSRALHYSISNHRVMS